MYGRGYQSPNCQFSPVGADVSPDFVPFNSQPPVSFGGPSPSHRGSHWSPRNMTPNNMTSPGSGNGYRGHSRNYHSNFKTPNGFTPRFNGRRLSSDFANCSTPQQQFGTGARGYWTPQGGMNRTPGPGPGNRPPQSAPGKFFYRRNLCGQSPDYNPGGSPYIKDYFHPNMLDDPWKHLRPIRAKKIPDIAIS